MNRRGFLKLLGVGAAAAVAPAIILPERKIWAVGFGAPRDVHGALSVESGTRLALMQQLMDEQAEYARRVHENHMQAMLTERYGDPSNLRELRAHIAEHDRSLALRVGSQDLTFERPSEETFEWARWDDETGKLVYADVDKAEVLADASLVYSVPTPKVTHSVLWTGITGSKT